MITEAAGGNIEKSIKSKYGKCGEKKVNATHGS